MHSEFIAPSDAEACFAAVLASSRSGAGARGVADKTFDDLDWGILTAALAARCLGRDAAELAADLGLLPDAALAERRRAELGEAAAAVARAVTPPLRGFDALGDALVRASKGDVLSTDDLVRVGRSASASQRVIEWARTAAEALPLVREHCTRLQDVRDVAAEVGRCIDAAGEVADEASPELGPLRRRVARLREGILARLDRIVKSPRYEGILQDDYVTIRDERYVLPVRAGERGDFPGIVHGQSGSGQTLFIEPQELIEANNELRIAQLDVDNEVRRILERLSDLVRRRGAELEANQDILVYLDLSFAAARLSDDLGCSVPRLAGSGAELSLHRAGHPVLLLRQLEGELDVVSNDLALEGRTALVVSGPNTGGKTVTLKTIGLCALMTRAGLPIPVGPDSVVPWFEDIHSDIGDEQSVDRDLSTFSGHVANIARFLPACRQGSLVLLDELFAGTDPAQGAALGRALLDELVRRGATVVVTTHLDALKTLGLEDARYAVASVGFDVERLRPTYALRAGVPGSSYALRIAGRLGLEPSVIAAAEGLLEGSESAEHEGVILRLEAQYAALRSATEAAERERIAAEREARSAREQRQRLAERAELALEEETRALRDEVRRLRELARDWVRRLRDTTTPESEADVEALRRAIEEARAVANEADGLRFDASRRPGTPAAAPPELRPGATVWVSTFRRNGEIVELDEAAGRALVRIGPLKTNVAVSDLRAGEASEAQTGTPSPVFVDVARTEDNTVDLRGERVDEALERLDAFLDRAARGGGRALFVVHGHGTGALKRAVRSHLGATPYPLRWRAGEAGEGGDGVTVVELA